MPSASFFDIATVAVHDGQWTYGPYPMEYYDRAFETQIVDICNPAYPLTEKPDVSFGSDATPFAIVGHMRTPTRCEPEEFQEIAENAMARSTEYRVTQLLWHGPQVAEVESAEYLTHPDITTVPRGATHLETVAAALKLAHDQCNFISPILHLGFETALSLSIALKNLNVPFVVGLGYPANAIAVTHNDIRVNLSSTSVTNAVQAEINRRQVEITQFASFEFDATKVVRAA